VVRALNDKEDSPLHGEIKLLGVGRGRVAQAPLAQELKSCSPATPLQRAQVGRLPRGLEAVLRQLLQADLDGIWRGVGRAQVQHQVGDRAALVHQGRAGRGAPSRSGARGPRRLSRHRARDCAVGRRIGDLRFETEGAWKRSGTTVESLARELKLALEYPKAPGSDRAV